MEEELPKFIQHAEAVASQINGESPSGDAMFLGDDVLLYFKLAAFEQPVLTRLRTSKEGTLADEISSKLGYLFLGEPEAVRAALHTQIDKLFDAIKQYRLQRDAAQQEHAK